MKNIMIQASEKANLKKKGVDDKNFKIILEPEGAAASVFKDLFKTNLNFEKKGENGSDEDKSGSDEEENVENENKLFEKNDKILVFDAGAGTVDITSYIITKVGEKFF
jgi:hypothetical protein